MENIDIKFTVPPKKIGLNFHVAVDSEWAGFGLVFGKLSWELHLGFVAFRLYFCNEEYLRHLLTLVHFNDICTTHKIDLPSDD